MITMREAIGCPFQIGDCHMANHSPPTTKNAISHNRQLAVSPRIAIDFAALN